MWKCVPTFQLHPLRLGQIYSTSHGRISPRTIIRASHGPATAVAPEQTEPSPEGVGRALSGRRREPKAARKDGPAVEKQPRSSKAEQILDNDGLATPKSDLSTSRRSASKSRKSAHSEDGPVVVKRRRLSKAERILQNKGLSTAEGDRSSPRPSSRAFRLREQPHVEHAASDAQEENSSKSSWHHTDRSIAKGNTPVVVRRRISKSPLVRPITFQGKTRLKMDTLTMSPRRKLLRTIRSPLRVRRYQCDPIIRRPRLRLLNSGTGEEHQRIRLRLLKIEEHSTQSILAEAVPTGREESPTSELPAEAMLTKAALQLNGQAEEGKPYSGSSIKESLAPRAAKVQESPASPEPARAGRKKRVKTKIAKASVETKVVKSPVRFTKTKTKNTMKVLKVGTIEHLSTSQPSPPRLCHQLDRVLFNPGIYNLQDPRTRVYNFDPYLEHVMPVQEFDFTALKPFVVSSKDSTMREIAQKHGKKYTCSTSSVGHVLAQFHRLLSRERDLNFNSLSRGFIVPNTKQSAYWRGPCSIFLRWRDGTYAIDPASEFDEPNILSKLGHSLEKLLTRSVPDFERYRKDSPEKVPVQERDDDGAFHFSTLGNFLMRSQLDAHDPRLPGSGVFDLKTRAVHPIRMLLDRYEDHVDYSLRFRLGEFESFEREYYDMMRSTATKYMLQVRMGNMDGIFVAYHNVKRIFGFQYISRDELDDVIHGQVDRCLGDQEFTMSVALLDEVLERATRRYPKQSLQLYVDYMNKNLLVYVAPVDEEEISRRQEEHFRKELEYDKILLGMEKSDPKEAEPVVEKDSTTTEDLKDMTCFKLSIQSTVNGADVVRPEQLEADDKWQVSYDITEMAAGDVQGGYLQTRKRYINKHRNKDGGDDYWTAYGNILGKYSLAGKRWLQYNDQMSAEHGKVRV